MELEEGEEIEVGSHQRYDRNGSNSQGSVNKRQDVYQPHRQGQVRNDSPHSSNFDRRDSSGRDNFPSGDTRDVMRQRSRFDESKPEYARADGQRQHAGSHFTPPAAVFTDVRDWRRPAGGQAAAPARPASGLLGAGPLEERRGGLLPGPSAAPVGPPVGPVQRPLPAHSDGDRRRPDDRVERVYDRPVNVERPSPSPHARLHSEVDYRDRDRDRDAARVDTKASSRPVQQALLPTASVPRSQPLLPSAPVRQREPPVVRAPPPSVDGKMYLTTHAAAVAAAKVQVAMDVAEMRAGSLARLQQLFQA